MATPRILDDPEQSRHAWARFRRIMAMSVAVGLVASIVAVWLVGRSYGTLGWIGTLAILGGGTGSVACAGALMGLAFLSSGTGHDETVRDFVADPPPAPGPRHDRP